MIKVEETLTNGTISNKYSFYRTMYEIIQERGEFGIVEMTEAQWMKEIMKRTNGCLNPMFILEELKELESK